MDIPEKLQTFADAFDMHAGGCRETCECGKIFFDEVGSYDWEDGELEGLQDLVDKGKAVALDYAVSRLEFEGRMYVMDCNCWHKRAENISNFLKGHSHQIVDFLKREHKRLQAQADAHPGATLEKAGL